MNIEFIIQECLHLILICKRLFRKIFLKSLLPKLASQNDKIEAIRIYLNMILCQNHWTTLSHKFWSHYIVPMLLILGHFLHLSDRAIYCFCNIDVGFLGLQHRCYYGSGFSTQRPWHKEEFWSLIVTRNGIVVEL